MNRVILDRAVDLWCKKLLNPTFDNGDCDAMMTVLATSNIEHAKDKIDDLPARIEVFRTSLTDRLVVLSSSGERFSRYLSVDYDPCTILAEVAAEVGIPDSLFSVKSSVTLCDEFVITSFGYGADYVYHYPIDDKRWLVTTLTGSDISKIIDQIKAGNTLGFTVDEGDK